LKRRKKQVEVEQETARVFCALTLDRETIIDVDNATEAMRRSLLPAFRFVRLGSWHITLRFYGDVEVDKLDALGDALAKCAGPPVPVELRAVGAFPDMRSPRVLWVGVKAQTKALDELYWEVNATSRRLGYGGEPRRFTPHITIARAREGGAHPVARELTPLLDTSFRTSVLREMVLYQSTLTDEGPRYQALRRFELKP